MKDTMLLKAQVRDKVGSKWSAKMREQGNIPGTVYGHKEAPVSVSFNAHDLIESLHHSTGLVAELEMEGKKETVIFKDLQYDYLGKDIIHVDLMRVSATQTVTVNVPLEFKGEPVGIEEGGVFEEHANQIEVECRVTDIPELIEVSVKELGIGANIYAKDLKVPDGVTITSPEDMVIAGCSYVTVEEEAEEVEGEEMEMPEVIGEKKEEEGEEGEPKEGE